MDKKHKTLLKRYRSLEGQLESMKGGLERVKDAPNAGTASKMLRRYRNTMTELTLLIALLRKGCALLRMRSMITRGARRNELSQYPFSA
jgi:hypothetical protein